MLSYLQTNRADRRHFTIIELPSNRGADDQRAALCCVPRFAVLAVSYSGDVLGFWNLRDDHGQLTGRRRTCVLAPLSSHFVPHVDEAPEEVRASSWLEASNDVRSLLVPVTGSISMHRRYWTLGCSVLRRQEHRTLPGRRLVAIHLQLKGARSNRAIGNVGPIRLPSCPSNKSEQSSKTCL